MPQHQIIGLALLAIAVVDTVIGNLFVVPRVADPSKRTILRAAFGTSGVMIGALGYAIYAGVIAL
jgi:hypothetical protein